MEVSFSRAMAKPRNRCGPDAALGVRLGPTNLEVPARVLESGVDLLARPSQGGASADRHTASWRGAVSLKDKE